MRTMLSNSSSIEATEVDLSYASFTDSMITNTGLFYSKIPWLQVLSFTWGMRAVPCRGFRQR